MTTEQKLRHFREISLEQARLKSNQLITEHRTSLEKIEQEHKTVKKRQAELKLKTEYGRLKRAENVTLSKEKIEIKRCLIKKHNELKEMLAVEIRTMLEGFMNTPDYPKLLVKQIKDILAFAGASPVSIYIDPADSELLSTLSAATGVALHLNKQSFLGGTQAVIEDRHVLIDNSFETLLKEEMEKFKFDGGNIHE